MLDNTLSQYAKVFDESCYGWTTDRDYNLMILKHQENHFNDLLRKRGYVFLRDVYEGLGMPVTKESCLVGWVYEENNTIGDNFVSFDIQVDDSPNITIDFNVDGCIINKF